MKNQELRNAMATIIDYCKSIPLRDCASDKCELYQFCKQDECDGVKPFMKIVHDELCIELDELT